MESASLPDGSVHTLTSTLSTQPLSLPPSQNLQPGDVIGHIQSVVPPSPETPAKRRPGRPKGSGKKPVDPNAEPKVKRPVGRPRKDGLPAGSVGPKKPPRTRKRPPGTYATPTSAPPGGIPSYAPPFVDPAQWQASISASMGGLSTRPPNVAFPLDPALDRDNWMNLARSRPDAFLYELVTALHAPNSASPVGGSVEEAYRAHLASLNPAPKAEGGPPIPALYSILKTFWLPSSPTYFSLTASASANRVPSEHRFFYWDPQPIVFNGIACPVCSQPLINKGRISSGPIKVYDLGKPFYIIGCEYVCRSPTCMPAGTQGEGRRYASTDMSILRSLPPKLKDEFPAHLIQGTGQTSDMGPGPDVWSWRPMGVSTAVWDMVRASLRSGLHKDVILAIVHATMQGLPEDVWAGVPEQPMLEKKIDGVENGGVSADAGGEGDAEDADAAGEDAMDEDPNKEGQPEEYQEAWAAHNEAPEASGSGLQAGSPAHPTINSPPTVGMPEYPPGFPPPPPPGAYMPFYHPPYGYYQAAPPPPGPILKRTFSVMADSDGTEQTPRRVRHCVKCGSNECKGKGGYIFCSNPCQDCGKVDCRGRNSKKPDKTCTDAWAPAEPST